MEKQHTEVYSINYFDESKIRQKCSRNHYVQIKHNKRLYIPFKEIHRLALFHAVTIQITVYQLSFI